MKTKTLILILLLFNWCNKLTAQWQQTNGPFGGNIDCLLANGNDLFAGTYNGVWKTSDFGATWYSSSDGIPFGVEVVSLTIDGNNIYASTCCNGLYWSTDYGATWVPMITQFPSAGEQSVIVDSQVVYVASGRDLYSTIDTGMTYTNLTNGITGVISGRINAFVKQGNYIFLGTEGEGILSSNDNGLTWNFDTVGLTGMFVKSINIVGSDLFASTTDNGVFVSHNLGLNWSAINNGLPSLYSNAFASQGTLLYTCLNQNLIFNSNNNGGSWTPVSLLPANPIINCFAAIDSNLFVGTSLGVYKTTNNGTNWQTVNFNLAAPSINYLVVGSNNTLFSASAFSSLYTTNDNGNNWFIDPNNQPPGTINCMVTSDSIIFASTSNSLWSSRYTIGTAGTLMGIPSGATGPVALIGSTIYCNTTNGVYRSFNNGASWNSINAGIPNGYHATVFSMANSSVYAGTNSTNGLFYTTNGFSAFAGWGSTNLPPVVSLVLSGTKAFVGVNSGIYSSTNNGVNYSYFNTNSPVNSIIISGTYVFAGSDSGVFFSDNNGLNWTKINDGLLNHLKITSLAAIDTNIFAGSYDGGVFLRSISNIVNFPTNIEHTANNKHNSDLFLYPNPTNSYLNISTRNKKIGKCKLAVYDIIGNALLTSSIDLKVETEIDVSFLNNGIYYIKIEEESHTFSLKFIKN